MKSSGTDRGPSQTDAGVSPTRRRGLLVGAGVAGAAVLAVKAIPQAPVETVAAPAKPAVDDRGGYQLTQHVLRYYETTKV